MWFLVLFQGRGLADISIFRCGALFEMFRRVRNATMHFEGVLAFPSAAALETLNRCTPKAVFIKLWNSGTARLSYLESVEVSDIPRARIARGLHGPRTLNP